MEKSKKDKLNDLKSFKDTYVQDFGFSDWEAYLDFCSDQGFSFDEMCIDDLIISYVNSITDITGKPNRPPNFT